MIFDLKETLNRQNEQIETLREELTKADSKIELERQSGEKRILEMRDVIQRMKDDYNKLKIGKENSNSDKLQSEKSKRPQSTNHHQQGYNYPFKPNHITAPF